VDWLTQFPDNPWSQDILRGKSKDWEKDVISVQKDIFEYHQEFGKKNGGKSAFQPNDGVIETVLTKEEGTLIHLDTKLSYALNRTGLRIWCLLKEGYGVHEIVEKLHEEFEVDRDRVKKDVVGLIEELSSLQLITPLNEGPTNRVNPTTESL
jgi:hypothetical protein